MPLFFTSNMTLCLSKGRYVMVHKVEVSCSYNFEDKMFTRGMKRKCNAEEDIDGPLTYSVERQSLLNMSLVKLQLCHMLVEPNLCRSVLIANTVRQIQEEMTQDGSWQILTAQTIAEAPVDRLLSTDILCHSSKDQDQDGEKGCDDHYVTYGEELEVHQVEEVSDLSTLTSIKLQNSQPHVWEVDSQQEKAHFQKSLEHIFETLESRNTSTVEDLFSEVDTSYYDLDTVLTGMMGNSKLSPPDVLDGVSQTAKPSSCKTELNEVDHIVEILVES
uniref:Cell division cycle associated 4 n=1 Tax=Leptobrachium leishanense TaxID=445787 RepID=A0A8C5QM26_9ANUR